tara:strand:- start:224 stop:514 length:291 start_codon:yes stop_codon:yes gene_type:complete
MTKPNDDHEIALTSEHWGELKDRWAELTCDSMDPKSMEQFVYETIREGLDDLTATQSVRQFEDAFDRETVDQVIRDITSEKSSRLGIVIGDDPCYS